MRGGIVTFLYGEEDDRNTVENLDMVVTLPDRTRWSATLLSLAAIDRIMKRWRAEGGDCRDGAYFNCPDLVIIERGGIPFLTELVQWMLDHDEVTSSLKRLRSDADDDPE